MEARVPKVTKVSARFSKSFARPRLRANQENVRSTTQRRGRTTKPFMSSLRLTISILSSGTFATAASTCQALYPPSAQISSSEGEAPSYLIEHQPGPIAVLDRGRVDNHPHRQSLG